MMHGAYNVKLMGICCEAVSKHMHTLCGKKEDFLVLQQVVRSAIDSRRLHCVKKCGLYVKSVRVQRER